MTVNNSSISIILNQYKKDNITEEEAIQLIEELCKNNTSYIPYYPYWPQITYDTPQFPKYEITCKKE
jgi:hypothetical protein